MYSRAQGITSQITKFAALTTLLTEDEAYVVRDLTLMGVDRPMDVFEAAKSYSSINIHIGGSTSRPKIRSACDFVYVLQFPTYIIIPSELTSHHVFYGEFGVSRIVVNQSDCSVVVVI